MNTMKTQGAIYHSKFGPLSVVLIMLLLFVSCNQDVTGSDENSAIKSAQVTTSANVETPCDPGFFSATGNTPCEPAPVGKYVPEAGATEAIDCPVGRYQDEIGQATCKLAEPGSFVSITGAAQAELCAVGTYQNLAGQTSCKPAEPGSFVDFEGAAASSLCPVGTYSDVAGAAICTVCPEGQTTDGPGATACIFIVNDPTTKADCKNGGWDEYGFKNQGQCIRFVNTGKDSR